MANSGISLVTSGNILTSINGAPTWVNLNIQIMQQETVQYPRIVRSCAMSKRPKQNGIQFSTYASANDTVRINSINPKLNKATTDLYIEIPKESIQDVIDALKLFK